MGHTESLKGVGSIVSQTRGHRYVLRSLRRPPRVGKLCFDRRSGLMLLRSPTKRFSDFVNTHGENNRNH